MKFFGSSLAMANNLKVAFLVKILPQKRTVPLLYLVINMTDWFCRVFLKQLLYLVTAVERKISILLRGKHKEQVQSAAKISLAALSSTQTVSAKSTERLAHRPQLNLSAQNSGTVTQDWQLWKAWAIYQTFGLFEFFSK